MNKGNRNLGSVWFLASFLALGACSDSSSLTGIEGTGSPQTGEVTSAATGTVSSYGSIVVNGVHYDVGNADIEINGEPGAAEDAIELGMVVSIRALLDEDRQHTEVLEVRSDRKMRGVIDEVMDVDITRKDLDILGQTVVVQDDIVFANASFETLVPGMTVSVSGFTDEQGRVVATRVGLEPDGAGIDLEGVVTDLDRNQQTFILGSLPVEYTDALFVDGSRDDLMLNQPVELKGGVRDEDGVLAPAEVHIAPEEPPTEEGESLSLEGVVGQFDGAGSFRVRGVPVDASGAQFNGGSEADLRSGVRLIVEGKMAAGILQAKQLRFLLPGITRILAEVDAVDPEQGELTVLGNRYQVTPVTGFEDRSAQANRFLTLESIAVGELVEVFSRYRGDQLTVTRLRRLDGEAGQVGLRGPVTRIDGESLFSVMGVMVEAESAMGSPVSELARGDMVVVEGRRNGAGSMVADHVSLPEHVPCPGRGNGPPRDEECDPPPGLATDARAGPTTRLRF